jgi:septum formation protein
MADKPTFSEIVLASGSSARRELLGRFGLPFLVDPADIDETPGVDESPADLVERLSREKARAVADRHPGALVIGSDQAAVFEGHSLGKPGTSERACRQLTRFSGQAVTFLTGVCVIHGDERGEAYALDTTRVQFRVLGEEEIERYVARDQPLACAGAFKVESLGPSLFEAVRSEDPTGLQGLPLIALARLLRDAGCPLP